MARFTVVVEVAAPLEAVWARLTDWPAHGRWIPLTAVRVTSPRPDGVGAVFVGRSALGPIGFDDPMRVEAWSPPVDGQPGRCQVRKLGRVLLGSAGFEVEALPESSGTPRTRVTWVERVELAPAAITRPAGPLIALVGRIGFTRALRKMARELEEEVRAGG